MAPTLPPPPAANTQNTKSPSERVSVDHHDSDRLSGFVSALPDFTTQNVGLKTEFEGTKTMTGKFLKGGNLLSKSWDTLSYDTPLKRMEEN